MSASAIRLVSPIRNPESSAALGSSMASSLPETLPRTEFPARTNGFSAAAKRSTCCARTRAA